MTEGALVLMEYLLKFLLAMIVTYFNLFSCSFLCEGTGFEILKVNFLDELTWSLFWLHFHLKVNYQSADDKFGLFSGKMLLYLLRS